MAGPAARGAGSWAPRRRPRVWHLLVCLLPDGGAEVLLTRRQGAGRSALRAVAAPGSAAAAAQRLTAGGGEVCGEGGLCSGHGACDLETGLCRCERLFAGPVCKVEHCPGFEETGLDCNGHGVCESGACKCAPGWGLLVGKTGANICQDRVCPLPCGDHGKCVAGACQCLPGWTGPSCRDPQCLYGCSGHGACVLPSLHSPGECICDYGWAGAGCERKGLYGLMQRCPRDCSGNGLCLDGRCACNVGFAGPACSEVECGSDFSGPRCDLPRCPSDCHAQGLCLAGQCACWEGYSGNDCSVPLECVQPCRRFCQAGAESSEQCIFCVGQCTTARSHSGHLGRHNPFEDLESTL
mmetsp:Transcript_105805/g.329863  ORF Transcript_105805/g.329863 Transcript_105805/m.329863 type:complete len:352 (-) Transcript_105805:113-1168(-)